MFTIINLILICLFIGKLPIEVDMEGLPLLLLDPESDTETAQESPPTLPPK